MRGLALGLLLLSGCAPPAPLWLPLPAEGAVLYFLKVDEPTQPEVLGRAQPGTENLRLTLPADPEQLLVLAFEFDALRETTPRLDPARWTELQLVAEAETCSRRRVDATTQRRPLPHATRSFTIDLEQETWREAPPSPELAARLSVVLGLDSGSCGASPLVMRPLARLEDGFTARGRAHAFGEFGPGVDPFRLLGVLGRPDGAVLARSSPYLYYLRAGRELQTAEPGEILAPSDVVGLPESSDWSFEGLQALPGSPERILVALGRRPGAQPPGALVEVTTSSAGFERARLLQALSVRPSGLAVTREGGYLVAGFGSSVAYARELASPPEVKQVPSGGSLNSAFATDDPRYPFLLTNTGGALILLDPWSGEERVLSDGALNSATRAVALSAEPSLRVEQLRYDGSLFSWVAPGPGTAQRVPMPPELSACAANGDACEPYYLSFNAPSMTRIPSRGLVFGPTTCGRIFAWNPEDDCLSAGRTEPPIAFPERFVRFETLVLDGARLLGTGYDGSVYAAALE